MNMNIEEVQEENSSEPKLINQCVLCCCKWIITFFVIIVVVCFRLLFKIFFRYGFQRVYSSLRSAEMITFIVILTIKCILTGLVFKYSKKGKYKLILPYLMYLTGAISVLLYIFLDAAIKSFENSMEDGFLVLTIGFFIIGSGVYFWIVMFRRYQKLRVIATT